MLRFTKDVTTVCCHVFWCVDPQNQFVAHQNSLLSCGRWGQRSLVSLLLAALPTGRGGPTAATCARVRAVSHLETGSACVDLKVSEPVDEAVLQVGVATANTHLLLSASHFSKTKNKEQVWGSVKARLFTCIRLREQTDG